MNKKVLLLLTLFSVFSGQFVEAGKKNKKKKKKHPKRSVQQSSSGGSASAGPQPGSAAYAAAALLASGDRASEFSQAHSDILTIPIKIINQQSSDQVIPLTVIVFDQDNRRVVEHFPLEAAGAFNYKYDLSLDKDFLKVKEVKIEKCYFYLGKDDLTDLTSNRIVKVKSSESLVIRIFNVNNQPTATLGVDSIDSKKTVPGSGVKGAAEAKVASEPKKSGFHGMFNNKKTTSAAKGQVSTGGGNGGGGAKPDQLPLTKSDSELVNFFFEKEKGIVLKKLLEESSVSDLYTILMHAFSTNKIEIVRLALAQKDVVNFQNDRGFTPLIAAINADIDINIVKLLLAHKDINVNLLTKNGLTPLVHAIVEKKLDIVRLLLAHKDIDVNATDKIKNISPLMAAVVGQNVEAVKLLLAHKDIKLDTKSQDGHTALDFARNHTSTEIAELILAKAMKDKQVELTTPFGFFSVASLHKPSTGGGNGGGGAEPVRSISAAEAAAAIKALQHDLRLAIRKNDHEKIKEICLALQQNGDDINTFVINPPRRAATALLYAAGWGKLEAVKCLLEECNANILQVDVAGRNILHYAATSEDEDTSIDSLILDILEPQYLYELNALINAQDNDGNTPLHFAKNVWNAIALIDAGAQSNVTNNRGRLPKFVKKATTSESGGGGDAPSESK